MGKNLGFEVIAECVETAEVRNALLELGCTVFQGYLYSPAVPLEKLREGMAFPQKERDAATLV